MKFHSQQKLELVYTLLTGYKICFWLKRLKITSFQSKGFQSLSIQRASCKELFNVFFCVFFFFFFFVRLMKANPFICLSTSVVQENAGCFVD